MAWFVYIVKCRDDSFYTGITWNLKKRIKEHNSGKFLNYTKSRVPVKLVYWERFDSKSEAAKKEKEIKGWRREKKEKLINAFVAQLAERDLGKIEASGSIPDEGSHSQACFSSSQMKGGILVLRNGRRKELVLRKGLTKDGKK